AARVSAGVPAKQVKHWPDFHASRMLNTAFIRAFTQRNGRSPADRRVRCAAAVSAVDRQRERLPFEGVGTAPYRLDRRNHPPVATEYRIRVAHQPRIGRGRWGEPAQGPGELGFVAVRIECRRGDVGRSRRTADAGEAVDDQRGCTVPAAYEAEQRLDVIA